jgi:hypothetical protein
MPIRKKMRLIHIKNTRRAFPSRRKFPRTTEVASQVVRRAAETSPMRASAIKSFWVAAKMILPSELLITAVATAKLSRIATSKLPLKNPEQGRVQREGSLKAFHAK